MKLPENAHLQLADVPESGQPVRLVCRVDFRRNCALAAGGGIATNWPEEGSEGSAVVGLDIVPSVPGNPFERGMRCYPWFSTRCLMQDPSCNVEP